MLLLHGFFKNLFASFQIYLGCCDGCSFIQTSQIMDKLEEMASFKKKPSNIPRQD